MGTSVLTKIEALRTELNHISAEKDSLVDAAIVQLSQELDAFIIDYYKTRKKKPLRLHSPDASV